MTLDLRLGDCIEVMRTLPEASVDAVVTDPPYGIGFMGREWDNFLPGHRADNWDGYDDPTRQPKTTASMHAGKYDLSLTANRRFQAWCEAWAREALRVLKPGGCLLAFGGPRTYHRLACGIEDAGFEVRDSLLWLFGSGFPKSSRVSRDPRFCQCDESEHSGAYSSLLRPPVVHNGTAAASLDGALTPADALHSTQTPEGSRVDCLPDRDLGDAPAHPEPAPARSSSQRRQGVRVRSRSDERADAAASESGHSPSPARRSAHRASPGSPPLDSAETATSSGTPANIEPSPKTGSGSEEQASDTPNKDGLLSAWPHCNTCGKPNTNGWGTALKPAYEPIVQARKPLAGTVAATVLRFGTGGLNIDGCRIAGDEDGSRNRPPPALGSTTTYAQDKWTRSAIVQRQDTTGKGRWPANVVLGCACEGAVHDAGCAVALVDVASGECYSGASRFFYTAKTSRSEREAGLDDLDPGLRTDGREPGGPGGDNPRLRVNKRRNTHPTVKPVALMRWLCRLVTSPGGIVLDPFLGSGSTGMAALDEGFSFIGIEKDGTYLEIARRRIEHRHVLAASGDLPSTTERAQGRML